MPRIPLLAGSRLLAVDLPADGTTVRPPPPARAVGDVRAAVRDALRFPLHGDALAALVTRGGRATVVVEPPALPLPGVPADPRRAAIEATVAELERTGVALERQTLLVAGGLARRAGQSELELLVSPTFARRFSGRLEVHDAEADDLLNIGPARVHPALVQTDAVVVVTSAETVLHGGPGTLLAAAGPETLSAATAASLVETAGSEGWTLATAVDRELARRVPLVGVSLALNSPTFAGALRGYPYEAGAVERLGRLPGRRAFGLLPGVVRRRVLRSLPTELTATAVFAGPPAVAHAEALLRGVQSRSARVDGPFDAVCIGIPPATPYLPRENPNPLLAAYLGLGLALRLWRDRFPVTEGGTAILLHRFSRRFAHPTQQPYRAFFQALRTIGSAQPEALADAEHEAARDDEARRGYREGRTCHPLLPYADWRACRPALDRLGAVLVAGCRDATAARQLGFVPTHGVGAALEMARGRAGRSARIGFLLAPPYFPLQVSGEPAEPRPGT
jgi:Lactate racemase N-terminal domain